mmetsp:Transcript_9214/g.36037  ORF Transcript_9214/g.36037 Transcript_9214/m.36037 type:complete len:217 (-) Transcript_9214:363-1013(-)
MAVASVRAGCALVRPGPAERPFARRRGHPLCQPRGMPLRSPPPTLASEPQVLRYKAAEERCQAGAACRGSCGQLQHGSKDGPPRNLQPWPPFCHGGTRAGGTASLRERLLDSRSPAGACCDGACCCEAHGSHHRSDCCKARHGGIFDAQARHRHVLPCEAALLCEADEQQVRAAGKRASRGGHSQAPPRTGSSDPCRGSLLQWKARDRRMLPGARA